MRASVASVVRGFIGVTVVAAVVVVVVVSTVCVGVVVVGFVDGSQYLSVEII